MNVSTMEVQEAQWAPLFFGAKQQLFGCYHGLRGQRSGRVAVHCYPFGQEYLRAHRSSVQLASRLVQVGVPVLRFDYFGCGDSSGDTSEGTVEQWISDVRCAAEEARDRSGADEVSLIGLRMGASLAAMAALELDCVESLVLWDPIISGTCYLQETAALQRQMLAHAYVTPAGPESWTDEVLGFELTSAMRAGLAAIDLSSLVHAPAERILLLESEMRPEAAALQRHLEGLAGRCEYRCIPERRTWLGEIGRGLVPRSSLEAVVGWLAEPQT
jgi:uncharacterized protein